MKNITELQENVRVAYLNAANAAITLQMDTTEHNVYLKNVADYSITSAVMDLRVSVKKNKIK